MRCLRCGIIPFCGVSGLEPPLRLSRDRFRERKSVDSSTKLASGTPLERLGSLIWQHKSKLIGFALTLAFVALIVRSVNLADVGAALLSANYAYVLPAACVTLFGYWLRTYRWKQILKPARDVPTRRLFPVLIIGFATNNILPARVGEVARAYALGRKEGVSKTLGLSSVILERLLDGLTLVTFMVVLSDFFPLPEWGSELVRFGALVFVGALAAVVALLMKQDAALGLLRRLFGRLPLKLGNRLMGWTESGVAGLHALRSPRQLALIACVSLAIWLCEATSYVLVLKSFYLPLDPASLLYAGILVLVVVNLGIMVPSAPGYIGTFHFFFVMALQAFGIGRDIGLGVALVSHAMQYVTITGDRKSVV
jgi:glycosyltransferase 2 family protein